ncbi:MAG: MFS transporter [Sedimentisphaerales bacterium]|nr:MFS transporter [Sedimentisphaerales bacterium]
MLFRFMSGLRSRVRIPWIYTAAFLMSFYGGIWMVTIPFVVTFLGGSDRDLGLCASLGFGSYLAGCAVTGSLLARFDPRRLAQLGAVAITGTVAGMFLIVAAYVRGYDLGDPVLFAIIVSMLSGVFISMYWPPIMGWLSTGHEGKDLNWKLGVYNVSWSAGLAVSPFVGGYLVQRGISGALVAAMVFSAAAFVAVTLAHPPRLDLARNGDGAGAEVSCVAADAMLVLYRRVCRIALVSVFICVGLMKTQLALLFKMELGFSESQFGTAMTVMCAVTCVVFLAAAKLHGWHYRFAPLLAAQVAVGAGMVMIIAGSKLGTFFVVSALVGFGLAFVYFSHQFYAASRSASRAGSMALHEVLLSTGHIIGFIAGGYLAEYFGRRAVPYWFGVCVIVLGIAAQLAVWSSGVRFGLRQADRRAITEFNQEIKDNG